MGLLASKITALEATRELKRISGEVNDLIDALEEGFAVHEPGPGEEASERRMIRFQSLLGKRLPSKFRDYEQTND